MAIAKNSLALFACIGAGLLGLDQVSKLAIERFLATGQTWAIIPGTLEVVYSQNPGNSFGFDISPFYNIVISAVFTVALIFLFKTAQNRRAQWGWFLAIAGSIGNIIDRALRGSVIDFIYVHGLRENDYTIFNLADLYIWIGILLVILGQKRRRSKV